MRLIGFLAAMAACAVSLSAEIRVVSTTSQGKTTTVSTEVREAAEGAGVRVLQMSDQGSVSTLIGPDYFVRLQESSAKDGTIRMACDGKAVEVSGTWKGKALSGRYELKDLGFYGNGFEFALRALARSGSKSLKFPMIDPTNPSKANVMELTRVGTDSFRGRAAIKVRISLSGIMSALWSAQFLIAEDGTLLRYAGNQGPGTPDMVTELVEVRR